MKHCTETYCKYCKHEKYIDHGIGWSWFLCKKHPCIYKDSRMIYKEYLICSQKNINRNCKDFEPTLCTKLFNEKMIPKWYVEKNKK